MTQFLNAPQAPAAPLILPGGYQIAAPVPSPERLSRPSQFVTLHNTAQQVHGFKNRYEQVIWFQPDEKKKSKC